MADLFIPLVIWINHTVWFLKKKTNITALSRWVCAVTLNDAGEGSAGEHIASFYTEDQGQNWNGPFIIHKDLTLEKLANSYSAVVQSLTGRIYVVGNANLDNITHTPDGHSISRTDEIGYFAMRYSDNGGHTWCDKLYKLPYRETMIDQQNTFKGFTNIFWNVDQFKIRNGTVYAMFTKIQKYPQNPPQQGYIISSDNLLTENDAEKIRWVYLPDGNNGPHAPPDIAYHRLNVNTTIAEEWHIIPLRSSPGFFSIFRTSVGFLGASWTHDPTGKIGWVDSTFASFAGDSLQGTPDFISKALKNPRGPITLKRFSNGNYLLLWYNNAFPSYGSQGNRSSRNPYWISAARESLDRHGTIEFSQPEVVLYGVAHGDQRPGYPDFIEDVDGSIWISETQKTSSRVHRLPHFFLNKLWNQFSTKEQLQEDLVFNMTNPAQDTLISLPSSIWDLKSSTGFAIDFWLNDLVLGSNQVLLTSMSNTNSRGIKIVTMEQGNISLVLSDGVRVSNVTTDWACTASFLKHNTYHHDRNHYVAFNVDAAARIMSVVVNGKVCDGSFIKYWGWSLLADNLFNVEGEKSVLINDQSFKGSMIQTRVYNRSVLMSELIGNWRYGL